LKIDEKELTLKPILRPVLREKVSDLVVRVGWNGAEKVFEIFERLGLMQLGCS